MKELDNSISYSSKQLGYFGKSMSADKHVCKVSGNLMSSRDADERLAAHYAGKQYIGWNMVREKLAVLREKYKNLRVEPKVLQGRLAPPEFQIKVESGNSSGGGGGGGGGSSGWVRKIDFDYYYYYYERY